MGNNVEAIKNPDPAPKGREELLQGLDRLGKYFSNQEHTYLESYEIQDKIRWQKKQRPASLLWGIGTFYVTFILIIVIGVIDLAGYIFHSTSLFFRIFEAIPFLYILLGCIAVSVFLYVRSKHQINQRIDELNDRYEEWCVMMPKIYNAAENCFVAYEHCDPKIIYTLYRYIQINQASTYSEALRCMIDAYNYSGFHGEIHEVRERV